MNTPITEGELAALNVACPFELMQFTLTYEGELSSSGNSPKPQEKWQIRRAMHPQLAELWQKHPVLSGLKYIGIPRQGSYWKLETHHSETIEPGPNDPNHRYLCDPLEVGGHKIIPLVRNSLALVCHLDIQFLRKEAPGHLFKKSLGGDLDNRIKTLFDGLRMPKPDELQFAGGEIDEPFYSLCEDDDLITGFNVNSEYLLTRPNGSPKDVHLVIGVKIKVTHVRSYNMRLLGD